jgi:hypothetical protein
MSLAQLKSLIMLAMLAIDERRASLRRATLLRVGSTRPSSKATTLFRALFASFLVEFSALAGVLLKRNFRPGVGSTVTSLKRGLAVDIWSGRMVASLNRDRLVPSGRMVAVLSRFGVKQNEERSVRPDGE